MAYGEMNDPVLLANQISRGVPQVKGLVTSNTRFTNTSPNIIGSPTPDADYIWRGIIAKGGKSYLSCALCSCWRLDWI